MAPYRIDQFNSLNEIFDLKVIFIFDNVWNHKFDQSKLLAQVKFNYSFLLTGPRYKGRVFRFGMLRSIREFNPDIILGYEFSFTTLYLILLKKAGIIHQQLGSTIDDSIEICNNVQSSVRKWSRKISIENLDYLIVLSREVADFYSNVLGFTQNKIIVSPILQNENRLRKDPEQLIEIAERYFQQNNLKGKRVLLFVGRFISEKGLVGMLEIIAPVLKDNPDLVFLLVGDGIERDQINAAATAHGIEKSILMPGRFEGPELLAWYFCASGFILPSVFEPFGAVVNEALIFGLPVLCSKFVGSKFLLDNPDADLIFDPLDANESVVKVKRFISVLQKKITIEKTLPDSKMRINYKNLFHDWKTKMYDQSI